MVGVGGAGVVVLVDWVVVDFSVVLVDSVVVFSVVVVVDVVVDSVVLDVVEVLVVFLCLSGITSVVVVGCSGAAAASTLSTSAAAARMTDTEPALVMKIIINQREVQQGKVKRIYIARELNLIWDKIKFAFRAIFLFIIEGIVLLSQHSRLSSNDDYCDPQQMLSFVVISVRRSWLVWYFSCHYQLLLLLG